MRRVHIHILTRGMASSNVRAFLYPILTNRRLLEALGFDIAFLPPGDRRLGDCDVVMVESKALQGGWGRERSEKTLALLSRLGARAGRLLFFDLSDSAGWINGAALSAADRYYKMQVLRDRRRYLAPLYGRRAYTDYYHRAFGIEDAEPESDPQVRDEADLAKIHVAWNAGLADYSLAGPALMRAYERLALPLFLRPPRGFVSPSAPRDIAVSCRMGIAYARETVAYQRRRIREILGDHLRTDKLGRRAYFAELARARIVVSPFGLGEITLKDFEVFITGGLLLKPEMAHMETWPDFYQPGKTMLSHHWDLSNLEAVIEAALDDRARSEAMAEAGQALYRRTLCSREGREAFAMRFKAIVEDAPAAAHGAA